ncbi:MAG: hypothetical protein RBU24_04485 [Kiritimatiellia bacterium]|nr:hypothetical protein [Kiritimatiellia bacterium]
MLRRKAWGYADTPRRAGRRTRDILRNSGDSDKTDGAGRAVLAAEYRQHAEDAADGREARMLADLAAQVWAQIVDLEAGGTGTPAEITP